MAKTYSPPEMSTIIGLLLPIRIDFEGRSQTIDEWRIENLKNGDKNRQRSSIGIFNMFVSGLLEGYGTRGEGQENQRRQSMDQAFQNLSDVTNVRMSEVLMENGYYLMGRGLNIAGEVKNLVEQPGFSWEDYFRNAEAQYEQGFPSDAFLKIKGIGSTAKTSKTRDYALSQFSKCYCAIDRNIARVIRRTGLLLHGYGQPDFGTGAVENYRFLQKLIIGFSKQLGWSPQSQASYSPKEIDTMLWFFSYENAICQSDPQCHRCPITGICLHCQSRV